ncbi:hypothetical protein [Alloalcanivorax mobilis]|uniref:hypothetical protein n=1 Tax=Alloalcanivorax mobilis TaxID=2019569 RepID=UPI000C75B544|nr:hypothetical protein [Alloalcanivorax mobilis]
MNEARRQWYLKAMGLTPWVARAPLPGAAPSELLDWRIESENDEGMAGEPATVAEATPVASPQRPASPPPAVTKQAAPPPVEAEPQRAPEAAVVTGEAPALAFTLEAHLAGDTWVMFEQEDAQAPGLGRYGAPLAASLLAVFGVTPQRPRRFYCPLTADQPMSADEAAQALQAFVDGLARQAGGARVMLCLAEQHVLALFGAERYQPFTLGERPALAISTLAEMLAEPATHKARSWRAMVEGGFAGGQQ